MRIRGTFLKDYIQVVLDTPDLEWENFLDQADWDIIKGPGIIPTQWYPIDTMAHIGQGIFEMRSKRNYEVVRLHGRARATDAYDAATQKFLLKGDPIAGLKAYTTIAARYVDEVEIKMKDSGPGHADISFWPVDEAPAWDLFREIQAGTMEKLAEMNGGKNPRAEFIDQDRDGRLECVIRVRWE